MRKSSIAKGLGGALAVLTSSSACSHDPQPTGQLMLAIQTDMSLPKDVDQVTIQILSGSTVRFNQSYVAGGGGMLVPATLGIVAGANQNAPVKVRVIARQKGVARVLREAVSTIPQHRSATLRVPIQWLCDGSAKDDPKYAGTPADPNNPDPARELAVTSSCPDGQTCKAGVCVPVTVGNNELESFDDEAVFGGGSASSDGSCFDTQTCFAAGFGSEVEPVTCSIEKPSGGAGLNVALVKPLGTDGICSADSCLVPLDAESDSGWRSAGSRIVLPHAVCDRMMDGSVLSVAVTTSCATKAVSIPTCGPWSSVGGDSTNPDANGPNTDGVTPPIAPPPPTAGAPAGDRSDDLVLAVRKFYFDKGNPGSDWAKIGYNLDHLVTIDDASSDCKTTGGTPAAGLEGVVTDSAGTQVFNGIDNVFGHFIAGVLTQLDAKWATDLNQGLLDGTQTVLLDLGHVKDQQNYLGLSGAIYTGDALCALAGDAGACGAPRFDGTDQWPVTADSVIGGDPNRPNIVFPGAYMTGRYWVSGTQASSFALKLKVLGHPLTLTIHRAVATVKVGSDGSGTQGVLAGVLDTQEFLGSLQQVLVAYAGTAYCSASGTKWNDDIASKILPLQDILTEGPQDTAAPCNGISFGVGFEAKPVKIGGVTLPVAPAGDLCAGVGGDAGTP